MRGSSSSSSSSGSTCGREGRNGDREDRDGKKEEEMQHKGQNENAVNLGRSAEFGMQSTSGRNMGSL